MWQRPEREYRFVGARAPTARATLLGPEHLGAVHELLTTDAWWDTVDILAPNVVGPLARRVPDKVGPALDGWALRQYSYVGPA